jgi:hypothetical protein
MLKEKIIRWTPRILSVYLLAILYLLSFDVFEIDAHWTELLLGFLMHNIPAFILTIALIFAWKRPWIGAIIFALAGIFYIGFMLIQVGIEAILAILSLSLPALIASIFYFLDYLQLKK